MVRIKQSSIIPDFVVFHQPTTASLNPPALLNSIRSEVAALFGDYGSGAIERNLSVKYLSLATSTFILKVKRSHYRLVWAALTFMNHVPVKNGKPCTFKVVRVSGTIRKAEQEAIRQARQLILASKESSALAGPQHLPSLFTEADAQGEDTIMFGMTGDSEEGSEDDDG